MNMKYVSQYSLQEPTSDINDKSLNSNLDVFFSLQWGNSSYFALALPSGRAILGVAAPALLHQVIPGRFVAASLVLWAITIFQPAKKFCNCSSPSIGPLSVPHLPQDYCQAVDIYFLVIQLGIKHFGCHIGIGSCDSACNNFCWLR